MGKIFDALQKHDKSPDAAPQRLDRVVMNKPMGTTHSSGDGKSVPENESVKTKLSAVTIESLQQEVVDSKKNDNFRHAVFDSKLVTYHAPDSFESEQFKALRTRLLFPYSGERCRSIMVCSALPSEGKTFVAANLAISIARTINEYVLLVDCDIRNPSIGSYFGLGETKGLSDYLSQNISLSELLIKTEIEKLSILTAGCPSKSAAELISSRKMADMLEEITSRYPDRFVIIDSPPPNLIAEANAISKQVEGIILVIRQGKTKREAVMDLLKNLGRDKIIGAVVNRQDLRAIDYNGYHGFRAYRKYYSKYKR